MGCEAYGSDLNPVAALLTWAAVNIIGGGEKIIAEVRKAQEEVYKNVDEQIIEWGIEHNDQGWRADAYLYCLEATCPSTNYKIPLSQNWIIGEKTKTVAKLVRNDATKSYDIEIHSGVTDAEMDAARESFTVKGGYMINPEDRNIRTAISIIRGDRKVNKETITNLRMWENEDLIPRKDDVFQERLYCIRFIETYYEKIVQKKEKNEIIELTKNDAEALPDFSYLLKTGILKQKTRKRYIRPTDADFQKEYKVFQLLKERFKDWQSKGYIPSYKIERGIKTDEPIRTRGWTYWHHLFTPRQLLYNGLFSKLSMESSFTVHSKVACLTGIGRISDWNSKLCRWGVGAARESIAQTYFNQALNTLYNYAGKSLRLLKGNWMIDVKNELYTKQNLPISLKDARDVNNVCDIWITDPPYGDAINYHELNDFFIAWYRPITKIFPNWYFEGKKELAIKGTDESFRKGMVEAYSNLTHHMPKDGAQVVMFTHQNTAVWADLALILWSSGLQVSSAWTIATETDSALKEGNHVQGTVCMVLRKQTTDVETFINDVYPEVEHHVTEQLKEMTSLDDKEDPNFSDSDYQLAAYAAALRVLTSYRKIYPIDVQYELNKPRKKAEKNEVEKLIDKAVEIATNYLVPEGLDKELWISLRSEEKFYLKGLEVETHGEYRNGVYQEFARGFGIKEYKNLLSTGKANETRLRSAIEFKNKNLHDEGFGSSILRKLLFAIYETVINDDPKKGKQFLRDEVKDYWNHRQKLIALSRYIQNFGSRIEHWQQDAKGANLLAGALENDHV
jgi:hypothetical protein